MKEALDMAALAADMLSLIDSQRSCQLATCRENGEADTSYAPYLQHERVFYLFVSGLAAHTGNMLRHGQASLMIIQPESEAANIFARQRAVFNCRVEEVAIDTELADWILDAMQNRFGEVVGVLRSLPDFHLLALSPQKGRYVAGFGMAYTIDMEAGGLVPRPP